jgi:hypothetical protein
VTRQICVQDADPTKLSIVLSYCKGSICSLIVKKFSINFSTNPVAGGSKGEHAAAPSNIGCRDKARSQLSLKENYRRHLGCVEFLAQFLDHLIGRGVRRVVQSYCQSTRLGIG